MKKRVGIIRRLFLFLLLLQIGGVSAVGEMKIQFGREAPPKTVEITFADISVVAIPKASQPVKLGQPFNKDGWARALKVEGFSRTRFYAMQIARGLSGGGDAESFLKDALKPRQRTKVFLTYDDDFLYVGFQCWDDDMSAISVEPTQKRDSAVWGADSVEIFIAPWKSSATYFRFIVDSRGTIYDAVNRFYQDEGGRRKAIDKAWNSGGKVFSQTFDTYWIVQLQIPLKDLGLTPNDRIRMNLCRSERIGTKVEFSSWIPVEESFHETERFAEVCFDRAPDAPPVKIEKIAFPDPLWGENGMKVWLRHTGKADTRATIRAELLDAKGNLEDSVSRHISLRTGKGSCVVYLPYRITEFGKHTISLVLAAPNGNTIYEQRMLPLATPDLLYVQCPDAFFSTQPSGVAVTTLNVSPASLDEVQLRYTVLAKDKAADEKKVPRVDSRVIYTQIGLEKIQQDVPCELRVEVIQKAAGKVIGRQIVPFRRAPLSW